MEVKLEFVETIEQIRENVATFARDAEQDLSQVTKLAKTVTYWVYDPDSEIFAPNTFVGYRSMNFDRYAVAQSRQSMGKHFDGTVASDEVRRVLKVDYATDPKLEAHLKSWLIGILGSNPISDLGRRIRKFVSLPASNYWALFCNPDRFDGESACRELSELTWTFKSQKAQVGDGVIIWQGKGRNSYRGIVGIGEIIEDPQIREELPQEKKFWKGEGEEKARRCLIRLVPAQGLPLWEAHHKEFLSSLKVARAHGGTVFSVAPEEWREIARLSALGNQMSEAISNAGQGILLDPRLRKLVELYAQHHAEDYFQKKHNYEVEDVSQRMPYDLLCRKGEKEIHVEAKGTTGDGRTIFLTRNEVDHARTSSCETVLYVVSNIEIEESDGLPKLCGGKEQIFWNWQPDSKDLIPIQGLVEQLLTKARRTGEEWKPLSQFTEIDHGCETEINVQNYELETLQRVVGSTGKHYCLV